MAQKIDIDCLKNLQFEEKNNDLIIFVDNNELKFESPKEPIAFRSCKITMECNNNYLNLIYTFQNGNNYKIVNNIFKLKEGLYYLSNIYIIYSDKYQTTIVGIKSDNIKLQDYSIKSDLFDKDFVEKDISYVTGHQDNIEIEQI